MMLAPPTVLGYGWMTFPAFRPLLQRAAEDASIVAIGASEEGKPVGLVLCQIDPDHSRGEILSIFVVKERRREGLGTTLLARAEEALQAKGCIQATLRFSNTLSSADAIEKLLKQRGWSDPGPSMLLAQVGREIMEAPWFRKREIPSDFEVFRWIELRPDEREALERTQVGIDAIPRVLWPFTYKENLEPCNSLGLRHRGQVVGWVITNRIAPKAVRYSALYVRDEFRHSGRPFALLAEAIQRQAEWIGYDSIGTFGVLIGQEFGEMERVVRRKFAPYLRSLSETRVAEKVFR